MQIINTGKLMDSHEEFFTFNLVLSSGDKISAIYQAGQLPLFSLSDFIKCINLSPSGQTRNSIIEGSAEHYTFSNRKIGTFVSIDGLIRASARLRNNTNNNFFTEVVSIITTNINDILEGN